MSKLHVRNDGVARDLGGDVELEHVGFYCFGSGPDGGLGQEEGNEIQERVW